MEKQPARKARRSSGSNSMSKDSKNVSHVPCKFFRQGVCQAGDSCPFSHAQESTSQTVCKYFQKGNCKFGAKCALAHLTPDGRRVSKDKKKREAAATGGAAGATAGKHSAAPAPAPDQAPDQASDHASEPAPATVSEPVPATAPATAPAPIPGRTFSILDPAPAPILSPAPSVTPILPSSSIMMPLSPPSAHKGSSGSVGSPIALMNRPSSRTSSFHFESSLFPSRSGSTSTSRAASIWTDRPKNPMAFEGSAVTDDEDDGFEEDLVPGTLSELLTPQERERRNSRHWSNSQQKDVSTDLWSQRVFHRGSFGRSERPDVRPKVEPIGPARD